MKWSNKSWQLQVKPSRFIISANVIATIYITYCTIFIESKVQRVLNLHGTLSFTIPSVTKIERWEMRCAELNVWGLNGCLTGKLFSLIRWKSISEQDKFWSTKLLNWITLSLTQNLFTQSDSILGNVVFKYFTFSFGSWHEN